RTRRLAVINELAITIARGQSHAPMLQSALEKLTRAIGARAAWFRLLDAGELVPTQHVGLSSDFLRAISLIGKDDILDGTLEGRRASTVKASHAPEAMREQLHKYAIKNIVLVPVLGKRSAIGLLSFGCPAFHRPSREELEFLETAAQKLGIAAE